MTCSDKIGNKHIQTHVFQFCKGKLSHICTEVPRRALTAASFIIGKMFKLATYSSAGGWFNKICSQIGHADALYTNKLDLKWKYG